MPFHEPIAIVGMSAFFPGGRDLRDFWSSIVAARPAFRRMPRERMSADDYYDADPTTPDKTYVRSAALIDSFDFDTVVRRVPAQVYNSADIVHWLALEQAIRAIEDAGYSERSVPRERTGVILGNTLTGEVSRANAIRIRWPYVARTLRATALAMQQPPLVVEELINEYETVFKSPFQEVSEDTLPGVISNTIAGRVCNHLDLGGGGYTVDGACASSLIAIAQAASALASGQLDLVLAGGVDVSIDPIELTGFCKMGAMARERMAVYSKDGQGFLPGEGCGWTVLKRLSDARAAGDYVYAVLHGWGVSSDGRGGLTAPSVRGQKLALARAYETTPYRIQDVDFVEGHGTGTVVGDRTELVALKAMLQGSPRRIGVTALKSITGHMKAAAGIGSFIKAVLAVNQRIVPRLAGCTRPHDEFDKAPIRPVLDGEVRDPGERLRAGVSSFGFGGINVHLAIESADAPKASLATPVAARALLVSTQDSELFVFEGDDPLELAARLKDYAADAAALSAGELVDFAAHLASAVRGTAAWRAAAVAGDAESLERKLLTLARILEATSDGPAVRVDPLQDCWVGRRGKPPRIGFMFPGQGALRVNSGRFLVERHPWAQEFLSHASAQIGRLSGRTLEELLYVREHRGDDQTVQQEADAALADTAVSQPAIGVTSLLFVEALRRAGVHPSAVAGHSFGELTALTVAGALTAGEFFPLARLRGEAMAAPRDRAGRMLSLACDLETATRLCQRAAGYVVVANLNSDRQVVVSGDANAIRSIAAAAEAEGIRSAALHVSNAFHSDFVADAATTLAKRSRVGETVPTLSVPVWTGVDGRRVREGDPLRAHVARQVVTRVEFVALATAIASEVDLVIEVGPGAMLCGLLSDIAATRQLLALPIEREVGSFVSLNKVLAASFVHGVDMDFASVFADRLVRPYTPPSSRRFIANPCEGELRLPARAVPRHGALTGGLDALIVQRGQVSPETLRSYLEARGEFLAAVVEADLRSGQWTAPAVADPPRETDQRQPPRTAGTPALEDVLLDLVANRTGYPRSSLTMEMKLLNDLSLESIAAGEIVVRAASAFGVAGAVDPAPLLDGSLADVARAIKAALGGEKATSEGDPLREPASLLDTLERLSGRPSWLRCFGVEYTPQALDVTRRIDIRHIVVASLGGDISDRLASGLADAGARVSVSAGEPLELPADADCIVAVVAPPVGTPVTRASIRGLVERILGALPPRTWRGTLVFLQPDVPRNGAAFELDVPLASFSASLHLERANLRVRSIGFDPAIEPSLLGRLAAAEASSPDRWSASRFDTEGRRLVPTPQVVAPMHRRRERPLSAQDVVIVSGGGRGISAELARTLGERTGARLALLGRSPLESADGEVRATLQRCEGAGVHATYFQCDVTDADSVARAVAAVETQFGPVTAIVHGAGLNDLGTVERIGPDSACDTLLVKLLGLAHLLQAVDAERLKIVVGLSSIIGVTGMPGNAWYAAGNAGLDRLLDSWSAAHPATGVLALAYSLWADVGMGVKLDVTRNVRRMGVAPISPAAGAELFMHLVEHDAGRTHLVAASRLGGLDTWRPHASSPRVERRFLETVLTDYPAVECAVRVHLDVERDPYLLDHVYNGTTLLPMVFGLEAMAQVALRAADLECPDAFDIEVIDLARPVVVNPTTGEDLIVHAEVLPDDGGGCVRVAACIGARQSGFQVAHFAATFVFGAAPRTPERYDIPRRAEPLPIDPVGDVYSRFLFHGPRFHVLKGFYELRSDYCVIDAVHAPTPAGGEFVLGDPYFRDALLQAGQVVIAEERGLPRRIERLEVRRTAFPAATVLFAEGRLKERTPDHIDADITVVDADGFVTQRLTGCRFAIVEHLRDCPTAEEIADPDERDARLLATGLAGAAQAVDVTLPGIALANLPGIHGENVETRYARERRVVEAAVADAHSRLDSGTLPETPTAFVHDRSGKPALGPGSPLGISLAHDRRYCVASAGGAEQGIDIEEVVPRSLEESRGLAGPAHAPAFDRLASQDGADRAAARIWSAGEAVFKARGVRCAQLTIARRSGDAVLFDAELPDGLTELVLTLPILLSLGRERVVAVVVSARTNAVDAQAPPALEGSRTPAAAASVSSSADLTIAGYDAGWVGLGADIETKELLLRWPVTFKEAANVDGTVRFTALVDWMGKAREIAIMPIVRELSEQLASGQWGMITNDSGVRVLADARLGDVVETRFSIYPNPTRPETTADLHLEWRRVTPDGTGVPLGEGWQSVTWVRNINRGQVRPEPLPTFFRDFIDARMPEVPATNGRGHSAHARGTCLWERPSGPAEGPMLEERDFDTGLSEANVVGNIYFAQYHDWMARMVDETWYRVSPQAFRQPGTPPMPRCLEASMKHLVDAMPFARIRVRLSLSALYEGGATFAFNFFVVAEDGGVRKLARGELEYGWPAGEPDGSPREASPWKQSMMNHLSIALKV